MSISNISSYNPQPQKLQNALNKKGLSKADQVKETARMFESALTRQMLDSALKPSIQGAVNQEGTAHEIQRYFLTDMLADSMSHESMWGISNILQAEFTNSNKELKNEE